MWWNPAGTGPFRVFPKDHLKPSTLPGSTTDLPQTFVFYSISFRKPAPHQ